MDIKRGMDHATKIVLEEPSWESVVARRGCSSNRRDGWGFFPNKRHPMSKEGIFVGNRMCVFSVFVEHVGVQK